MFVSMATYTYILSCSSYTLYTILACHLLQLILTTNRPHSWRRSNNWSGESPQIFVAINTSCHCQVKIYYSAQDAITKSQFNNTTSVGVSSIWNLRLAFSEIFSFYSYQCTLCRLIYEHQIKL